MGNNEGQLAEMPPGEVDAVVSSPPYGHNYKHDYRDRENDRGQGQGCWRGVYGRTDGQLTNMGEGDFNGVITSPPYENGCSHTGDNDPAPHHLRGGQYHSVGLSENQSNDNYGASNGQLGNVAGDTFWSAARLIVEQCYLALADGGVAVWVCKDFVRAKKRVPFSQQWAQLCVSCGFEPVAHIRAWLVEDKGAQWGLDGELVERRVEHKSFFRKLAEAKGSPRIDWEDVLVFRRAA